jgi:hypothetical protein
MTVDTPHGRNCNCHRCALTFLTGIGWTFERTTRRGWDYYAPNPGQLLRAADLPVIATNERALVAQKG